MITTSPINRLQHYSCLLALEQPARQIHFPTKPIVTQNNASRTLAGDLDAYPQNIQTKYISQIMKKVKSQNDNFYQIKTALFSDIKVFARVAVLAHL